MKINSIEIIRVSMPLIHTFRTANQDLNTNESVLVRFSSGDYYGWGEAAPGKYPAYSPEFSAGQFILSRDIIAPSLLGQDIRSGHELQKLINWIKPNFFAKAAFDLAWWDLHAKTLDKPLWRVLGGKDPTVDVGADFGMMDTIDKLLKAIDSALQKGYKRIKLKCRPGWDLDMVAAVRKAFPDTTVHIDCNNAYTLENIDLFKELDCYNLAMIEQPLKRDDLIDHATLQAEIDTPICLDESITTPDKARKAIKIKACRWINIKPGRVGGHTHALAINDICQDAGITCWVGGMFESAVGASHCLALATLPNILYPSDIFPSDRFYKKDLSTPPMIHSAPSQFTATMKPGIGAEPDPDELVKNTVEHVVLKA